MSTRAFIVVLSWLLSVAGGFGYLSLFDAGAPCVAASAPQTWPVDVTLRRSTERPTLLVLLHVESASSRETVAELALLMARVKARVDAHVLFVKRNGGPDGEPTDSPLWKTAAAIPGVGVGLDDGGAVAARFGAFAPGQVLLYDTDGTLRFAGGIGDAHEGHGPGRDALEATIRGAIGKGRAASFTQAPRREMDERQGLPR